MEKRPLRELKPLQRENGILIFIVNKRLTEAKVKFSLNMTKRNSNSALYYHILKNLNPILPGLLNTLQTRGGVFYPPPFLIRLFLS